MWHLRAARKLSPLNGPALPVWWAGQSLCKVLWHLCPSWEWSAEGSTVPRKEQRGKGNSLSRLCAAISSGPAGIRTLRAEASFEAQHISCCLHAPEIKDSKSEPGSQPKYQKIVVLLMCIIWCLICMHCLCILIPAFQRTLSHPWSHQQMDSICPHESYSFTLLRFFPPNCWIQLLLPRLLPYAALGLNAEIFFHKTVTISVTFQAAWKWVSSGLQPLCKVCWGLPSLCCQEGRNHTDWETVWDLGTSLPLPFRSVLIKQVKSFILSFTP